jgi:hypothetical protein
MDGKASYMGIMKHYPLPTMNAMKEVNPLGV